MPLNDNEFSSKIGLQPIYSTKDPNGNPPTVGEPLAQIFRDNFKIVETVLENKSEKADAINSTVVDSLNFITKKSILLLNGTTIYDVSWDKYSVSDFIPIYALKGTKIKGLLSWLAAQAYPIAFFAENKTIIGQAYTNIAGTAETETDITITDTLLANYPNAVYAKLGTSSDYKLSMTSVNADRQLSSLETKITADTSDKLSKKEDIILLSSAMFNGDGTEFADSTNWDMNKSPFLDGNGIYRYYPGTPGWFYVTKIIPVKDIKKVHYSGMAANNVSAVVIYDSNFNKLRNFAGTSASAITELDVVLDNNTDYYVRCSGDVRYPLRLTIVGSTYKEALRGILDGLYLKINSVHNLIANAVDNAIRRAENDNPLSVVTETAGLSSIFHNWGFIGDSLSSGANYTKEGASGSIFANYDYSWCQRLVAMIGLAKGSNWSVPGFKASDWIYRYWTKEFKAEYTTDGEDSYFKIDKKQVYTIYIGTNDAGSSVTVGSFDTDVDLSDFNNNANTFVGNYAGIIQRIKSISPSAKIFVMTCVPGASAENGGYNAIIRDMPNRFGNVFLLDLKRYMPNNSTFNADYIRMGHFSTQGYQYLAYIVANYIDYIIRKYPDSFKYVQILNTSYDDGTY